MDGRNHMGQYSDSARHRSPDICLPISQIVLKNFKKKNEFNY